MKKLALLIDSSHCTLLWSCTFSSRYLKKAFKKSTRIYFWRITLEPCVTVATAPVLQEPCFHNPNLTKWLRLLLLLLCPFITGLIKAIISTTPCSHAIVFFSEGELTEFTMYVACYFRLLSCQVSLTSHATAMPPQGFSSNRLRTLCNPRHIGVWKLVKTALGCWKQTSSYFLDSRLMPCASLQYLTGNTGYDDRLSPTLELSLSRCRNSSAY